MDELRGHERADIDRTRLAPGPALEPAVLDVVDVGIARRHGRLSRHREPAPRAVEAQVPDPPLGKPRRRELEPAERVEHGEAAAAVVIHHVGDVAPVVADIEILDIPQRVGCDVAARMSDEVLELELAELAILVRHHVHAAAVGREFRHADARLARMRGIIERRQRPRRRVREVKIALGDRDVLPHEELRVIRRPVERIPGVLAAAHQESWRGSARHVRDVHVVAQGVAIVAVESHAAAVVGPDGAAVNEAALGERTRGPGGRLVVDLRVLIAPLILQEREAAAAQRSARPFDRVLVERELLAHAERNGHAVQLVGVGEARPDQHAAVGEPVEKGRLARLLVARRARRECRVGDGDVLEDETAALAVLRGRERGRCRRGGRIGGGEGARSERRGSSQHGEPCHGTDDPRRGERARVGHAS